MRENQIRIYKNKIVFSKKFENILNNILTKRAQLYTDYYHEKKSKIADSRYNPTTYNLSIFRIFSDSNKKPISSIYNKNSSEIVITTGILNIEVNKKNIDFIL